MPDLAVLNDTFVDLLNSLGISHDYQHMFAKLPATKKWMLISQHKNSMSVRMGERGEGGKVKRRRI